jgi:nucleotide-binding universal stress UspA family protein
MKTYQQVLCPVDFSESSLNAARWGMEWAALAHCPLLLVHSYGLLLQDAETAAAMYPEMLRSSEDSMKSFLERLQVPQEIEVKTWSTPMDLTQELRARCQEVPHSLVVMSTKGAHGWTRYLLGSNAVSVLHSVDVPVLVIPETCLWNGRSKEPMKWMLAVDPSDTSYELAIAWLQRLAGHLNSQISPGYVVDDTERSVEVEYFLQWASVHFPNQDPLMVVSENPGTGINDLMLQSKADGLMMIARDKGWLRDLLRKHTTDEMVFMGRYPVLVVPERLDISENLSVSGPSGQ